MTGAPQHKPEQDKALIAAITAQDLAGIDAAFAAGASADARVPGESAPLFAAIRTQNVEVVKRVAAKTLYIDHSDDCDFTALTYATRMALPEMANALLDAGAAPRPAGKGASYPMDWAVQNGLYGVVTRMLRMTGTANTPDDTGATLLHYGAKNADMALMRACLKAGADINARDRQDNTVLHLTAILGNEKTIRFLLQEGADTSLKNKAGQTPVDVARKGSSRGGLHAILLHEAQRAAAFFTDGAPEDIRVQKPLRINPRGTQNPKGPVR